MKTPDMDSDGRQTFTNSTAERKFSFGGTGGHHHHRHPSLSSIIDQRLIQMFKFHHNRTSAATTAVDERTAMFERFRKEGIDPRRLNDSKKLPHVWRWLVDAEINCQSLRHQLEKMQIQHQQEFQEVEDYVRHVWKLSMERLISLQEENRTLHSKLNAGGDVRLPVETPEPPTKPPSVRPNSFSLSSLSTLDANRSLLAANRNHKKSASCIQLNANQNDDDDDSQSQPVINRLRKQLRESEERNAVLEKLNRCIEIENENFAFKLSECESQSNQLERRILQLEQECRELREPNANHRKQQQLVQQQQKLIFELNDKIKTLEERLDSKQMALELAEKIGRPDDGAGRPFSAGSRGWNFRRRRPRPDQKPTNQPVPDEDINNNHPHNDSDGFEEIQL